MAQLPPSSSPPGIPPPISSPEAPGTNGHDDRPDTGEYAKLQVQAKHEDKERQKKAPASHWDLVKSTVAILGTLAGIVLGFVAFGDRIVARAEGKTSDGMKVVKDDLRDHIAEEARHHIEVQEAFKEFRSEVLVEMKEQRADMKALYRAMPARRSQSRLELDVEEPSIERLKELRIDAGR